MTSSLVRSYAAAGAIVTATAVWLVAAVNRLARGNAPQALVWPMVALFALTALVWLVMLIVRNAGVIRGRVSMRYFEGYQVDAPSERIERPARTFNNLMQIPTLFYVVCILMMVTKRADEAQLALAWTFVALRALHALVYILFNVVPYRFAVWVSGFVTLCVLWFRFAAGTPFD